MLDRPVVWEFTSILSATLPRMADWFGGPLVVRVAIREQRKPCRVNSRAELMVTSVLTMIPMPVAVSSTDGKPMIDDTVSRCCLRIGSVFPVFDVLQVHQL